MQLSGEVMTKSWIKKANKTLETFFNFELNSTV